MTVSNEAPGKALLKLEIKASNKKEVNEVLMKYLDILKKLTVNAKEQTKDILSSTILANMYVKNINKHLVEKGNQILNVYNKLNSHNIELIDENYFEQRIPLPVDNNTLLLIIESYEILLSKFNEVGGLDFKDRYKDTKPKIPVDFNEVLLLIRESNYNKLVRLIENNYDFNVVDEYGNTLLLHAVILKREKIAKVLIPVTKNIDSLHNNSKVSPLAEACCNFMNHEIIEQLIYHGANVNLQLFEGMSALMAAAANGNTKACDILLKNGADIHYSKKGMSALLCAIKEKKWDTATFLVKNGASVKLEKCKCYRKHAIIEIIKAGNTELAREFITRKANLNVKDFWGQTPLKIAKRKKYSEIINMIENA